MRDLYNLSLKTRSNFYVLASGYRTSSNTSLPAITFFKSGLHSMQMAEPPLKGMEIQENEAKKD